MAADREKTKKHLLLDSRLISGSGNVELRLGQVQKHKSNPLFGEEYPWEKRTDNLYPNVLYDSDEKLYKCWYFTWMNEWTEAQPGALATCYAVSEDGLEWKKPLMDLYPFNGQPTNLVALNNHGVGIFKDDNDPDPERRYKLFGRGPAAETTAVTFSPDGLHWGDLIGCPEIAAKADTHNNALWVPGLGRYVGFTRLWDGQRLVGRTESEDFIHWTRSVEVLRGSEDQQTYGIRVFPYHGVYLGLLPIFAVTSHRRVHCELAWSPDTKAWHRIEEGKPFIPNSEVEGDYDYGMVYPALNPVIHENEIRLYYAGCPVPHKGYRSSSLALATLPADRFAGYSVADPEAPGSITTHPVECEGSRLFVSTNAASGSLSVELMRVNGERIAESFQVDSDGTDIPVGFKDTGNPRLMPGSSVRLRFTLRRANLFAFKFA